MIERVEVDPKEIKRLVKALNDEADGDELKRDLVRGLHSAAQPALISAKGSILSMSSQGLTRGVSLRQKLADGTKVHAKLSGRPGVSIVTHSRGMPRGFRSAPRATNSFKGWRHPLFGDRSEGNWFRQFGKPKWFHSSILPHRQAVIRAAGAALDDVANRIDRKTKG